MPVVVARLLARWRALVLFALLAIHLGIMASPAHAVAAAVHGHEGAGHGREEAHHAAGRGATPEEAVATCALMVAGSQAALAPDQGVGPSPDHCALDPAPAPGAPSLPPLVARQAAEPSRLPGLTQTPRAGDPLRW
ncbi:MAG TPA: hypothetical protein VHS99_26705, partial [Chloroflexota bacterium]|nr:hypothetical protein [Chloroflexota bacterium]